jgi:hypothetical protein
MEPANKQVNQLDLIKVHYRECFGAPTREAEFVSKTGERIEVWKWSEAASGEGVCIYATIGASIELDATSKRCEFFLGIAPEVDDVVESLAEVALHGTGTKQAPHFGDTVTLPWGLWNGTAMTTFLITEGGDEIIRPLRKPGCDVDFLQLVPLFPSECAYKKAHGENELWEQFESKQVPYWDSKRACALLEKSGT